MQSPWLRVIATAVGSATYTFPPPPPAPTFSVAPGTYTSTLALTISDTTPGVTIYYTTDGTNPVSTNNVTRYTGPIAILFIRDDQCCCGGHGRLLCSERNRGRLWSVCCERRRERCLHHQSSASGHSNFQLTGGNLYLYADGDNQRGDGWGDNLLHDRRHDAYREFFGLLRADHCVGDGNDRSYCHCGELHEQRGRFGHIHNQYFSGELHASSLAHLAYRLFRRAGDHYPHRNAAEWF